MREKKKKSGQCNEVLWKGGMWISSAITVIVLAFVIGYVFVNGVGRISWEFLTTKPSYLADTIGILPDILNTIYILIVTLVVLLPIGVGAAVYLSEYAKNKRLIKIIDYAIEILSGIPSIIYGLVGMLFFCNFLGLQKTLLAGAFTLVVMNLPTIVSTTKESLLTVPTGLREGAYGLGATKWQVVSKIVIPECIDGILTGCILATGRILGESAALMFTAGFAHVVNGFVQGIQSSGATLTVALYVYAKEQGEFEVAFAIGVILIILAVLVNLSTVLVKKLMSRKGEK